MIAAGTSALILAAGRGSRLGKYGAQVPKCLTEVGGERLIDSQLAALRNIGVKHVSVVGGYRIDSLRGGDYQLLENADWESTSMVQSIQIGLREQDVTGGVVIVYGDVYLSALSLSLLTHIECDVAVGYTLGWRENWSRRYDKPLDDLETFRLEPDGSLRDIGAKASTIEEIEGQFAGVLYLSADGKAHFGNHLQSGPFLSTTEVLRDMLMKGEEIGAFVVAEPWFEIDTERDLAFARSMLER